MELGIFRVGLGVIREAGLTFFREGLIVIFWEGLRFFRERWRFFQERLRLYPGGIEIFFGEGGGGLRILRGVKKLKVCVKFSVGLRHIPGG